MSTTAETAVSSIALPYKTVPPPHRRRRYIFGFYIPPDILKRKYREIMPARCKTPDENDLGRRDDFAYMLPYYAQCHDTKINPLYQRARYCRGQFEGKLFHDLPIFPLADSVRSFPRNRPPPLEQVQRVADVLGTTVDKAGWWRIEADDNSDYEY